MARTQERSAGVQVKGLAESMRALTRIDRELAGEAKDVFRTEAKAVQSRARRRAQAHPASPSSGRWIGYSASNRGAGVKLNPAKERRAHAAEWGMHRVWLWGRPSVQRALKRRTFRRFRGSEFDTKGDVPGFVIQPAIAEHLPGMEPRVADAISALMTRALDRAGVPRGRGS